MVPPKFGKIRTFTHGTKSARCASSVTGGPGEAYKRLGLCSVRPAPRGVGHCFVKGFHRPPFFSGGAAMLTISFQRFLYSICSHCSTGIEESQDRNPVSAKKNPGAPIKSAPENEIKGDRESDAEVKPAGCLILLVLLRQRRVPASIWTGGSGCGAGAGATSQPSADDADRRPAGQCR